MDVRIGNDIRLDITLPNLSEYELTSIKHIECYLINDRDCNCCHKTREPFPQFYTPSCHSIHRCGNYEYNVYPSYDKAQYACSMPCYHDYRWWHQYNGFGVCSKKFECHKPKYYLAKCRILEEKGIIEAYFPAKDQISCGNYKLVVFVTMYDEGWGCKNLHDFTIDYGNVFKIVCNGGEEGRIVIQVSKQGIIDDPTPTETVTVKFGQIDATRSEFSQLSNDEILSAVTKNLKFIGIVSGNYNTQKKCMFVMLPEGTEFNKFGFISGEFDNDILSKNGFNIQHDDIAIDGIVYKIYGYRNGTITQTNNQEYYYSMIQS